MDTDPTTPPRPADEGPQLYALTRKAGGYQLSRRGFLAAVAAGTAMGLTHSAVAAGNPSANSKPKGNKLLVRPNDTPPFPKAHTAAINSIAYSSDGRLFASASNDKTIKLWDADSGALQLVLKGHSGTVRCVAFSPDGKLLASGSADQSIRIWDTAKGEPRTSLAAHDDYVNGLAFNPAGTLLASVSDDNTVKIWDTANWQCKFVLKPSDPTPQKPTSESLAPTGRIGVRSVAFSPDGRFLASGAPEHTIKIWDVATGSLAGTIEGHKDIVATLAYSPDGRFLVSGSYDHTVRQWEPASHEGLKALQAHNNWVRSLAFSPDSSTILSGGHEPLLKFWKSTTGELITELKTHLASILSVAFGTSGTVAASGHSDGVLRLWELVDAKRQWLLFDPDLLTDQTKLSGYDERHARFGGTLCTCDVVCTCNTIWVPAGGMSLGTTCVCDTVTIGPLKSGAQAKSNLTAVMTGTTCTCNQVCTCDQICTCNTISTGGGGGGGGTSYGGHYWRPN